MDDLEEIYENFIDQIISDYPLTTNRLSEFDDAININHQIVNRISNIRRYLESNDQEDTFNDVRRQGTFNEDVVRRQGTFNEDVVRRQGTWQNTNEQEEDYIFQEDYQYNEEDNDINTTDAFDGNVINSIFEYLINSTLSDSTFTELNDLDDVKITLSKEQFNKFEKKNVLDIENITKCGVNCSICMDDYNEKEKVVLLKCNHYYHESCIENWLCNQKVTCPICRKDTREML